MTSQVSFETADPMEANAVLSSAISDNRLSLKGSAEGFRLAYHRTDLDGVRFDSVQMSMTAQVASREPLGVLGVNHVRAGAVDIHSGGGRRRYTAGDVFIGVRPHEDYGLTLHASHENATAIDLALLSQVIGAPAEPVVRRFSREPLVRTQAETWLRTVAFLREQLDHAGPDAVSPLVLGQAKRLIAATVVALWDPDHDAPRPRDRPDPTPRSVRRAIAFIEANAHRDIGVADIAGAAGVGVRALQLAFRRHLDTTPLAYLRRVRLGLAHEDLLAADPFVATVSTIAARWGFVDHSRFSAYYRSEYGHTPSQTLRT